MPPCDKPVSEVSFGEAANCVWGTIHKRRMGRRGKPSRYGNRTRVDNHNPFRLGCTVYF